MRVLDAIQRNMGRDTLCLAGQGLTQQERQDSWRMNRKNLSPAYRTRWADLPVAHGLLTDLKPLHFRAKTEIHVQSRYLHMPGM
jgi:hypothetical protein